jgi:hypothetical protein
VHTEQKDASRKFTAQQCDVGQTSPSQRKSPAPSIWYKRVSKLLCSVSMIGYGVSRAFVCQTGLCSTPPLTSPFLVDAILSESFWKCLKLARREQTCPSPLKDGPSWKILEMNDKVYEEFFLMELLLPSFPLQFHPIYIPGVST